MAPANDTAGLIHQKLIAAGCDDTTMTRCMAMVKSGKLTEMRLILKKHQSDLLCEVRAGQKQIDCLGFLIYALRRQKKV